MKTRDIGELPLYPEERSTARPTTEQVFRLFSFTQRHTLCSDNRPLRVFHPELTDLQCQVLDLLEVPPEAYRRTPQTLG